MKGNKWDYGSSEVESQYQSYIESQYQSYKLWQEKKQSWVDHEFYEPQWVTMYHEPEEQKVGMDPDKPVRHYRKDFLALGPDPAPCEICNKLMKVHPWADLDFAGAVVFCPFKSKAAE